MALTAPSPYHGPCGAIAAQLLARQADSSGVMPTPIAFVDYKDHALLLLTLPDGAPIQLWWYRSSSGRKTIAVWRFLGLACGRVSAADA